MGPASYRPSRNLLLPLESRLGRRPLRVNPCRRQPAFRPRTLVRTSTDTWHAERRPRQWRFVPRAVIAAKANETRRDELMWTQLAVFGVLDQGLRAPADMQLR